ncbi:MAG: hypothetical protein KIS92_11935 [Planctomycetota bacterium]|nr:hypothetical protein [Planctomycetota bacterium]
MHQFRILILAGLLASASMLWAEDAKPLPPAPVEDAIKLAKSGVGEDVQIAWAESREAFASVDADTILTLKNGGVGEKVIAALVRRGGSRAAESSVPYVRVVQRYETPSTGSAGSQAVQTARRAYTTDEAVQYTYAQPERVVYSYPSYSYSSSYYPYYSSYYPYYSSYYSSYYPYYRSHCYPSFSFSWGGRWGGGGHWGHGHGRCR